MIQKVETPVTTKNSSKKKKKNVNQSVDLGSPNILTFEDNAYLPSKEQVICRIVEAITVLLSGSKNPQLPTR